MISFMFFATNPSTVYTRLVNRGWLEASTDENTGIPGYRETIPHIDIVELPSNPVMQTKAVLDAQDNVITPAIPYPQKAIAVRISYDRHADETSEDVQTDDGGNLRPQLERTKIGKWIIANSTAVNVPGYLGSAQELIQFPARKLNNVQIWVIRSALAARLHAWL